MKNYEEVSFVSGGTSGLGLAVAQRFVQRGMRVVLFGRSEEKGLEAIEGLGSNATFQQGDVASEDDVTRAVEKAANLGRLTVAVHCAGVSYARSIIGRKGVHSLEDFSRVINTNLLGAFNVSRTCAYFMSRNAPIAGERGAIICCSSIAAFDGMRGQVAYSAAKAGIVGMTLPFARDLSQHAIRFVTLAPGVFDTPMARALDDGLLDDLVSKTPHPPRLGFAAEFAALVVHVMENQMINGVTLRIDGGLRLG
ncbi:SDR family NAD(P)-dependent oxidoreductase [Streptomyces djakartensis]|uniref:SDR family NAD(P)-dependent oxidoreductase n=1 Tax=Streptomyces djakartensis TaxID=68193 RepID=UPI0034DE2904